MYCKTVSLLLTLFFYLSVSAGDEPQVVQARLKSAMVYRSGAELVHSVKLTLKQGNNDVLISGVSNQLDLSSIRITGAEKLSILSVEFSPDFLVPNTTSPAVKRLKDSLEVVSLDIDKNKVILNTDRELIEVLKANKQVGGNQTGLSTAELAKMMDYYRLKSMELQSEIFVFQEKNKKLEEQRNRILNQLAEEERKNQSPGGRLKLQVMVPMAGSYDFNLAYLTAHAGWLPAYDLKVENISKPLNIVYKARVVQTTGIEWKQVKLSLSTSFPSQNGNAPIFKSWFLTYIDPMANIRRSNAYNNGYMNSLPGKAAGLQLNEVVVTAINGNTTDKDEDAAVKLRGAQSDASQPLYIINGKPASSAEIAKVDPATIKSVNILKNEQATAIYGSRASNGAVLVVLKDELSDYVSVKDNEMDVVFDIDLPYDVPATGKDQHVILQESPVPTLYKYYAAPKLDKDAYLVGELADWENLHLLAGEASIIFEGTYIGKTIIDPNSVLDTLSVSLGKDKRVVVKREKLKDFSTVKFLGANKKQVFTYELTVKNNKKEKIEMMLKDQYPISTNKEVEVELLESSSATVDSELGVLTWKLNLAPGESKKLRMSYSVKYPKEKVLNLDTRY